MAGRTPGSVLDEALEPDPSPGQALEGPRAAPRTEDASEGSRETLRAWTSAGLSDHPARLRAARGAPPAARTGARDPAGGAAALAAWAEKHKPALEVVAQRRDADGPMVDRALGLVRRFIATRQRIVFGGLAIDASLRLRGSSIYPDDERPDYDILSPQSVDDAYDLADELRAAGFKNVGAVRGIHVQTMKVRTDFVWVADIGYAPREVYDRIPTLDYGELRVVHPDFQRMDMHLAYCYPFNNPPLEDVYHRWRKDLKRFNLFEQHYPLVAAPPGGQGARGGTAVRALVTAALGVPVVGRAEELTVALHGFAAYAALRQTLDEVADALGAPEVAARSGAPPLALTYGPDGRTVTVELPVGERVCVMAPDPQAVLGAAPDPEWRDPYMDLNPETAGTSTLTVVSSRDRLLAVGVVRAAVAAAGGSEEPTNKAPTGEALAGKAAASQALVVSPQQLLLHFLYEAHRAEGPEREVYRAYYNHTLAILRAAETVYMRDPDTAAKTFADSPFAPSVRTMGTVNNSAAYTIKMAASAERLGDTPPPALHLPAGLAQLLKGLPQNYYPETAKARPAFDYTASSFFRRAGALRAGPAPSAAPDGAGAGPRAPPAD